MKTFNCKISTIRKFGKKELIAFGNEIPQLRPGQILLGYVDGKDNHIWPVYFVSSQEDHFFLRPEESRWELGDLVTLKGPIGSGFSDLSLYQNILLINFGMDTGVLSAVSEVGLKANKNIAISTTNHDIQFPPSVEIILPGSIEESIEWADFIAVDIDRDNLPIKIELFSKIELVNTPCELLIYCPILCSGNADCMVCTVNTKQGKVKTCKLGQVFDLKSLEFE